MNNITTSNYKLKTAICTSFEEYEQLILRLTDGLLYPEYEYEIFYTHTEKAEQRNVYFNSLDDVLKLLSEHFDTNVVSVHLDYIPNVRDNVWIVYEEA